MMKLKVFEVVAAGFDADTDDLVYWVAAPSEDVVKSTIKDTGARFIREVHGWSIDDADYILPEQSMQLSIELLEKASEFRNKNRWS